jgi:hypothetical protein
MATEKTLKTRVLMKTDTTANWSKATGFVPKKGEIIVYSDDARKFKVGDGVTKVSALKFVNQDELAKITTLGDELLAVKNGYLPLYGGTVTGTLTINEELYSNAAIISKRNNCPQLILQNANGAQLGTFYSTSLDGSYGNVLISVNNSSSDIASFTFAKDGQFTAPNDINTNGGILKSSKDSRPSIALTNASGKWLTSLVAETTDGNYSHAQLTVYKSATEAYTFTFSNQGSFRAPNTIYSSLLAVQSNNFPQLTLQNDKAANLATLYVNTTTGGYSSAYLRVYSSASAYSTFNFGNDGKLSCGSLALATALPISSGGTGSTTASDALSNLGGLAKAGDTMTGNLYIKNNSRVSQISFAPSFDPFYGGAIFYDAGGTNVYGGSTNFFIRQYSITNGATSSEGMGKFEQFSFPSTASGLTANASYVILTTKNPPTATQVGALPLTGGTLTGALTAKALYASDGNVVGSHLVTQTNNYPEVYFKNAAGTTLADFYVNTTSGEYADTVLKVFSSASTASYFTFGKDGTFGIPYSFSTMMGEFKNDAWPQMFFRNGNGNALAQLVIPTDNGSYSGLAVNVFSDASTSVEYKFNSDGTFTAPAGITTTGNYVSIKNNSYPQLTFSNASGADIGKFFVSTTNGSYAATKIRAYSSASSYYDFQFLGTGSFSCKTINADGIDIGADSLVQLSQNDNKGSGCISIGNINLGDWRVISVADDGRLLIDYTNPIYALGSSVIYSSSQPSSPTTGMIWLKPV